METQTRLYRSLTLCKFADLTGEAILQDSRSSPKILTLLQYQDTLSLVVPKHSEQVMVSLVVHKYTSLSTVKSLRERLASFSPSLLRI